jgi:hypothetical protein
MPSRNGIGCTLDDGRAVLGDLAQTVAIERVQNGKLQHRNQQLQGEIDNKSWLVAVVMLELAQLVVMPACARC